MENIDTSAMRKERSAMASKPLSQGARAPDFTLRSAMGGTVKLSDFRGRPVVLIFYPADFSPVCTPELGLFNELLSEFQRYDAALLGISVDNVWSHQAFASQLNLQFPLLSDFEPKGAVSRAYGVYGQREGTSERALFVVDQNGMVWWSYVSPRNVNPGADGILKALEGLKARGGKIAPTI